MPIASFRNRYKLRILEKPPEMEAVEALQRLVWPGSETEIVPAHMLLAAVHNGGLIVGAYEASAPVEPDARARPTSLEEDIWADTRIPASAPLIGFVFGFPGLYLAPDGMQPKHCSHMLGVDPAHRDQGVGFVLKRAQWQMVRRQGLNLITWTYDPLGSRNANLNISRLGAVCSTYICNAYGEMHDDLNVGLPTDRFQVDWWVNTQRVSRRLSKRPRRRLDLAHYLGADTAILNPTQLLEDGLPRPCPEGVIQGVLEAHPSLLLVEIPAEFAAIRDADPNLALEWRLHTRTLFEDLFARGYLATDFVHLPGTPARSFYVLCHGESKL